MKYAMILDKFLCQNAFLTSFYPKIKKYFNPVNWGKTRHLIYRFSWTNATKWPEQQLFALNWFTRIWVTCEWRKNWTSLHNYQGEDRFYHWDWNYNANDDFNDFLKCLCTRLQKIRTWKKVYQYALHRILQLHFYILLV